MNEALALLDKYDRRSSIPPCPDELKGLLKDLSDLYIKTGRKLGRDNLEREIRGRGFVAGRGTIHAWILESGGQPWFAP